MNYECPECGEEAVNCYTADFHGDMVDVCECENGHEWEEDQ